jgi:hypothetical protein
MAGAAAGACGGKILEEGLDPRADSPSDGQTEAPAMSATPPPVTTAPAQSATPSGDPMDIPTACSIICLRNGRCGALQDGCEERCLTDATSTCGPDYRSYATCFARGIVEGQCAAIPPDCERAYCAWLRCSGQPELDYCH